MTTYTPFLRALAHVANETLQQQGQQQQDSSSKNELDPKVFWPVNGFILVLLITTCVTCYKFGAVDWWTGQVARRQNSDEAYQEQLRARQQAAVERQRGTPDSRRKYLLRSFQRCKVHMVVEEGDLVDSKGEQENEGFFGEDDEGELQSSPSGNASNVVVIESGIPLSFDCEEDNNDDTLLVNEKETPPLHNANLAETADNMETEVEKNVNNGSEAQLKNIVEELDPSLQGEGAVSSFSVLVADGDANGLEDESSNRGTLLVTAVPTNLGSPTMCLECKAPETRENSVAGIDSNDCLEPDAAISREQFNTLEDVENPMDDVILDELEDVNDQTENNDNNEENNDNNPFYNMMDDCESAEHGYLILRETPRDEFSVPRRVPNCCAICLMSYEVGEDVVWSSNDKCPHAFHMECLVDWLTKMRDGTPCPCCRAEFTDIEKFRKEKKIKWGAGFAFNPNVLRLR